MDAWTAGFHCQPGGLQHCPLQYAKEDYVCVWGGASREGYSSPAFKYKPKHFCAWFRHHRVIKDMRESTFSMLNPH